MSKFSKAFLSGAASVLDIYPACDYIIPGRDGFVRDFYSLRGDCAVVCDDTRKSVKKYKEETSKVGE